MRAKRVQVSGSCRSRLYRCPASGIGFCGGARASSNGRRRVGASASTHRHVRAASALGARVAGIRTRATLVVRGGVRTPPFVLGVRRSGTTLLRVILDRRPGIAIPDETYFIPQLADRHPGRSTSRVVDDLRRLPRLPRGGVAVESRRSSALGCGRGGDRRRLFGVRGESRQAPLGRQDAEVHAASRPDRATLSRRPVRPSHSRRSRRRALVSPDGGGIVTKTWAHPRSAARLRLRVAVGGPPGGPSDAGGRALPRGSLRGARRRYRGRRPPICTSPRFRSSWRCRLRGRVDVSGQPHQQRLLATADARRARLAKRR